jgi:hypothetical protein
VTFSARSVVPAVAVQRRLEQNLAVRRIEYNQTELIFQALNAPAGNEYNAYIASYATQDGAVHERVLHALGQAVVDATYLPYTPPDPVDLYKQEFWRVGSPPNVIPPGADQQ